MQEVYQHNLHHVFSHIRTQVLPRTSFIAMDTEFPGVVARPMSEFSSPADYYYQTIRCNVDILRLIQVGLTFCGTDGEPLPGASTFQFNFRFSLSEDMFAADSIQLLQRAGIDFVKSAEFGIDVDDFAELLISSGLVLNPKVQWVVFHGGYDFCYLLKAMMGKGIPQDEENFSSMLDVYFPRLYDIKYLMHTCPGVSGGLKDVAKQLGAQRSLGAAHQAGSDAQVTAVAFVRLCERFFPNLIASGDSSASNRLYGFNQWV